MRVWFNHWFSTASHLIRLIRQDAPCELTVIGSNSKPNAVYRQVCDEWYPEQELPGQQYVAFCLDFCTKHGIEVFVPHRGLVEIVQNAPLFAEKGILLLCEKDSGVVSMLDDKIATYDFFEKRIPQIVPDYKLCCSLEEFRRGCKEMASPSGRICYKLSKDEGAKSFRVIDESVITLKALLEKPGSKVTYRAAEAILSAYDFSLPIILMPYFSGPDVSVDCMETGRGRVIIPRFKVGRYSEVRPDPVIIDLCNKIMDHIRFEMPANIQFKMEKETPYLLEINPRMSGGLQLSCLATGINLPAIAFRKLTGSDMAWNYPNPWNAREVVNLEVPVVVSEKGV